MYNEKHYVALNRLINSRQSYLGAIHDKDVNGAIYHAKKKYGELYNEWYNEDNTSTPKPKKAHCHIYLIQPNKATYTSVANSLGIECNFVAPVDRFFYRYLLHLDNTNKYQYADEYERICFGSVELLDQMKIAIDTPIKAGIDAIIEVAELTESYLYICDTSEYLKELKKRGFGAWLSNMGNVRLALQLLDKQHKRIQTALKKDYDDYKSLWEAENDLELHNQSRAQKLKYNKFREVK